MHLKLREAIRETALLRSPLDLEQGFDLAHWAVVVPDLNRHLSSTAGSSPLIVPADRLDRDICVWCSKTSARAPVGVLQNLLSGQYAYPAGGFGAIRL